MIINSLISVGKFVGSPYGNVLLNGYSLNLSEHDKIKQVPILKEHFYIKNAWATKDEYGVIDVSTGDVYFNETYATVRAKCAALFVGTLILQVPALTLNCVNRISKVARFLWSYQKIASQDKVLFAAHREEFKRNVLVIVTTPFIWVGLLLASLYGATPSPWHSPYDGRKLYATLERFAYSGEYERFPLVKRNFKTPQTQFLAPCFQPEHSFETLDKRYHLLGGKRGDPNAW